MSINLLKQSPMCRLSSLALHEWEQLVSISACVLAAVTRSFFHQNSDDKRAKHISQFSTRQRRQQSFCWVECAIYGFFSRDHPFRKFHSIWTGNFLFLLRFFLIEFFLPFLSFWRLFSFVDSGLFLLINRLLVDDRVKCDKFHLTLLTHSPPGSNSTSWHCRSHQLNSLRFSKQTAKRRDNTTICNQIFLGHFLSLSPRLILSPIVTLSSSSSSSTARDGEWTRHTWMRDEDGRRTGQR